jgi:hypothetical protein
MGKTASNYTEKCLNGKLVSLEFEGNRRDKYGRLLAYVIVDGHNFNIDLVREGLSPYYTKYGLSERYDKEFREAERYARNNGLNIWGDPELPQKYLRLKSKWGQSRTESGRRSKRKTAIISEIGVLRSSTKPLVARQERYCQPIGPISSQDRRPLIAGLYPAKCVGHEFVLPELQLQRPHKILVFQERSCLLAKYRRGGEVDGYRIEKNNFYTKN